MEIDEKWEELFNLINEDAKKEGITFEEKCKQFDNFISKNATFLIKMYYDRRILKRLVPQLMFHKFTE